MEGRIHSVETLGAVDGPGLRYVVFLQGCRLRCRYCHNPDTWSMTGGRIMTPEALTADILRYRNFLSGVTFSGGDPLCQPEFVAETAALLHGEGFHVAVDTAGYGDDAAHDLVARAADLFLLDIKALDNDLCRSLTGQDSSRALALLALCQSRQISVWIRHVLVPGLTLKPALLEELADFLTGFSCVEQVELLPYHRMGLPKWEQLGLHNTLQDTPEPTSEEVAQAHAIFAARGLPLHG